MIGEGGKRISLEGVLDSFQSYWPKGTKQQPNVLHAAEELHRRITSGEKRVLLVKNGECVEDVVNYLETEGIKVRVCNRAGFEDELMDREFYNVVVSCGPIEPLEMAKTIAESTKTILVKGKETPPAITKDAIDYVLPRASEGMILDAVCDLLCEQLASYMQKTDRDAGYHQDSLSLLEVFDNVRELEAILSRRFDFSENEPIHLCSATAVYPGAAFGKMHTRIGEAVEAKKAGKNAIVYIDNLDSISQADVRKIVRYADGVICRDIPNEISHLAIDLNSAGIPVVSLQGQKIPMQRTAQAQKLRMDFGDDADKRLYEYSNVMIDGTSGNIYKQADRNKNPVIVESPVEKSIRGDEMSDAEKAELEKYLRAMELTERLLQGRSRVGINADTVAEIREARKYGAEFVPLVRTENILKKSESNKRAYSEMMLAIASENEQAITQKSNAFRAMQEEEFYELMKVQCEGDRSRRTQVRLLDAPFPEFLNEHEINKAADRAGGELKKAAGRMKQISQSKATTRGVRIGMEFPAVYESQVKALVGAYRRLKAEGFNPDLRVIVPYVSNANELRFVQNMLEAEGVGAEDRMLGSTVETSSAVFKTALDFVAMGVGLHNIGTNDFLAEIGAGTRALTSMRLVHGRYEMDPQIVGYLHDCVTSMYKRVLEMHERGEISTEPRDWLSIGLCGEMNPTKIENFGRVLTATCEGVENPDGEDISFAEKHPIVGYISAGRAMQVPVLKYCLALLYARTIEHERGHE